MPAHIDYILKVAVEDNLRIQEIGQMIWDRAFKEGRKFKVGLPEVTEHQVAAVIAQFGVPPNGAGLVAELTDWFNNPDRDAPEGTQEMHPDLKWLASVPPERFVVPKLSQSDKPVYFYKRVRPCPGSEWSKVAEIGWGTRYDLRPTNAWSLKEIEEARERLARQEKHTAENQKDPYAVDVRDRMTHDLSNLPDYETWLETHGSDHTTNRVGQPFPGSTVHELYTMFRARLLDELHQAGVVGDDQ